MESWCFIHHPQTVAAYRKQLISLKNKNKKIKTRVTAFRELCYSSYNLNTPACNVFGSQAFHPKLCEASSVVERFGYQKRYMYRLVCWDCMRNDDPARIPEELWTGLRFLFLHPSYGSQLRTCLARGWHSYHRSRCKALKSWWSWQEWTDWFCRSCKCCTLMERKWTKLLIRTPSIIIQEQRKEAEDLCFNSRYCLWTHVAAVMIMDQWQF